jgi:chromosome segregation protein
MKIKSMKITGFKSFGVETEVSFHQGLNAVVGPNGCGKSNICDALRWVMGEQNVRHLRGDRLEDIIFAGSRENRPSGVAEVVLTVESNGGGLPLHLQNLPEIEITRRAYRTGESEYLINRKPCLLKEIRELFMDTGLNPRAYSIVEQGSIMDIVNSSPEDLRRMLEEAAGISKYRERKAATLRKLQSTRENLDRVRDLISEVERNVGSMRRQAQEARKFVVYQQELRRMDAALYAHQVGDLRSRREDREGRHQELSREDQRLTASLARKEAEAESRRVGLLDLERRAEDARQAYYSCTTRLDLAESRLSHLKERIADHASSLDDLARNREGLAGRLSSSGDHLQEMEQLLAEASRDLAGFEPRVEELKGEISSAAASLAGLRRQSAELTRSRQVSAEERRRLEGIAAAAGSRVESDGRLLEYHGAEIARLDGELARGREETGRLRAEAEASRRGVADLDARLGEGHRRREDLLRRERQVRQTAEATLRSLTQLRSRRDYLEQMQQRGEDLKEGARKLLRYTRRERGESFAGVLGHLIQVEAPYRKALEAALADRLEGVLMQGEEAFTSLVDHLREERIQGATAILLGSGEPPAPPPPLPGTLGPAAGFARAEPRVEALLSRMLEGVWLVADIPAALAVRSARPTAATLITLEGEVLYPWDGLTTPGQRTGKSLLELGGERERIQGEIADGERRLAAEEGEVAALGESLRELRETEGRLSQERSQRVADVRVLDASLAKAVEEEGSRSARRAALEAECQRRRASLERDAELLERSRRSLTALEASQGEAEAGLARTAAEIQEAEDRLRDLQARLVQVDLQRSSLQEKKGVLDASVSRLRGEMDADTRRLAEASRQLEETTARLEAARGEEGTLSGQMEELRAQKAEAEAAMQRVQEEHRTAAAEFQRGNEALRAQRGEAEAVSRRLASAAVELTEIRTRLEELLQRVTAETGFDLGGEFPAELADYLAKPAEEVAGRTQRLRVKMARIGPVNMAALEELQGEEERLTFLITQRDDLDQAVESLQEAIRKINRTSRELFSATFEAVAEKFTLTFRTLFNGGEAMLKLDEEADLLEAGIHIWAQPPGKKMTKLNLLSGGEKAMTAISLIFALISVRPSPFFLMDEVDAPLDEVNVERFVKLLSHTINGSQVVLITHNKRTMELADNLVGVTMESPGISRLVSVRLDGQSGN